MHEIQVRAELAGNAQCMLKCRFGIVREIGWKQDPLDLHLVLLSASLTQVPRLTLKRDGLVLDNFNPQWQIRGERRPRRWEARAMILVSRSIFFA